MRSGKTLLSLRRFVWRRLKRPGPPPGVTLTDAGDLFDEGMAHIRQGRCQQALRIARELDSYRYTGGWEIEAAALHEMGDTNGAIEVLREGIEKAPVWRNGHLLGIYLSEEGRYDEALHAFEASLTMREPQPKMTAYNRAIVLNRMGRMDEAVMLLEKLISTESPDEAEAAELASTFLAQLTTDAPTDPAGRRRRSERSSSAWRRR